MSPESIHTNIIQTADYRQITSSSLHSILLNCVGNIYALILLSGKQATFIYHMKSTDCVYWRMTEKADVNACVLQHFDTIQPARMLFALQRTRDRVGAKGGGGWLLSQARLCSV